MKRESGFTLLEVIIVIALLGILAGIAVPNYFGFQDRAKVSAARQSIHSLRTYLEIYRGDFKDYPEVIAVSGPNRGSPFTVSPCLYLSFEEWDKILAGFYQNTFTYERQEEGASYQITAQAKDREHTTLTATPGWINP